MPSVLIKEQYLEEDVMRILRAAAQPVSPLDLVSQVIREGRSMSELRDVCRIAVADAVNRLVEAGKAEKQPRTNMFIARGR